MKLKTFWFEYTVVEYDVGYVIVRSSCLPFMPEKYINFKKELVDTPWVFRDRVVAFRTMMRYVLGS